MVLFLLLSFSTLLFRDTLGTVTSQRCQEDEESSNVTTGSPNAPSGLICYREWGEDNKPFNCMWRRGNDLSEYRLCYCCDTCKTCRSFEVGNKTSYIVERDNLYMNKNLTFWVETANGNSKMKSEKLYVVPEQAGIKYKPLSIKEVNMARSAGLLTLSWAKPEKKRIVNEIRYQSRTADGWEQVNCSSIELQTYENCTILLDEPSAYSVQIRRVQQNIWSEWSDVATIPAEITERLDLKWGLVNEQHCPGRRRIELKWQAPSDVKVIGYNLTFEWAINMTGYSTEQRKTKYQTTISLAAYKVSVFAFNKVSTSPTETILIPAAQPEDIPDLNLTAVDNRTLKASWIPHNVNCYCAFLELVSTGTMERRTCQEFKKKTEHHQPTEVEFTGLEPERRYRLTIHAKHSLKNSRKNSKKCHSKAGYTIGSASACTQEYPPTHGPMMFNVTNVMKSTVFLQWKGISLGECQGTLEKYLIIYTDSWNHTYTASVNASKLNYTLVNLNASTLYTVKICGVTTAGQGAKTIRTFQTRDYDHSEFIAIIVATSFFVMLAVFAVVSLCYFSYKRTEGMVCPTVPHPVNSLAVKSIHTSDHFSQWKAYSEEDVTDVLLAVISLQNNTILPGEPATGDTMSMTEDAGSAGDSDSLGFGSNSTFEYRRQMGSPLDLEEDCSSEDGVAVQSPVLETCHVSPLAHFHSGSGLNLSGNMISLLSIYNQTPAEEEPARSSVDS